MTEQILQKIETAFAGCSFIKGIVLGGSRATGTASDKSDIDVGIYYDAEGLDYGKLNEIAGRLDDEHRDHLICKEGEWGKWVNCGGWLVIDGCHVDIIMRDWSAVQRIVEETDRGKCACHYQTGHPHAFLDVMYRGELASCRVLYAGEGEFLKTKERAELYPPGLQKALMDFFSFEAGFSCAFAEKCAESSDSYYLAGHLFRSVSALNQFLFALNEKWCLNEKKAVLRIEGFEKRPEKYSEKVNEIFRIMGTSPADAAKKQRALCDEVLGRVFVNSKIHDANLYENIPDSAGRLTREMEVYRLLERLSIPFKRLDHEPVDTIEACRGVDELLGIHMCKNLFLCNAQKTAFYLLLMPGEKKFQTREVSKQIGSSRLSFAPEEFLEEYLHISPGAVSIMGLMNDKENRVKLLVDAQVLEEEFLGCHPCVNTSSLRLRTGDVFHTFLKEVHHEMTVVHLT